MTALSSRRPGMRRVCREFRPRVEVLEDRRLLAAAGLGDAVLRWNEIALEAARVDHALGGPAEQFGPTRTSRALAVVHTAVFDAVSAIDRRYAGFLTDLVAAPATSLQAAAAAAAHDTLVALYPSRQATFDQALAADLAAIPDGSSETDGVALGQLVAATVLAARQGDGSETEPAYTHGTDPGRWQTDPLHPSQEPLTPGWGSVTPFTFADVTAFRAPPPPSLDSPEYAAAFAEVVALGGDGVTTPTVRTEEQTEIGFFWGYDGQPGLCSPPRLYNQIARVLAVQQHNTEVQNARLFALVNLALADAGIAVWDTKYFYDFWRPVTAVRAADLDGNPDTPGDAAWSPLGAPANNGGGTNFTPPFPAYTSGHAGFGAALFRTLERFYATDEITFTVVSDEFNGGTVDQHGQVRPLRPRTFDRFSQAAEENGQSRIYLGIHWSFDRVAGIAQGSAVADHVFHNYLEHRLSPAERLVTQLYRDLFDRRPDDAGLAHWGRLLEAGGTPGQVLHALEGSQEFRERQVRDLYRELLLREADPAGLASWANFLGAGGTEEQLQALLTGSEEYFQTRGGGTAAGFVDALYDDALGRTPDAAGSDHFLGLLGSGVSRAEVAARVFGSAECLTREVQEFYREFLGREAEAGGLNAWVTALQQGARQEDVLGAIMASPEYVARVTAR